MQSGLLEDNNITNLYDHYRKQIITFLACAFYDMEHNHTETIEACKRLSNVLNEIVELKNIFEQHDGTLVDVAKSVGMTRNQMYTKINKVGLKGMEDFTPRPVTIDGLIEKSKKAERLYQQIEAESKLLEKRKKNSGDLPDPTLNPDFFVWVEKVINEKDEQPSGELTSADQVKAVRPIEEEMGRFNWL